MAQPTPGAVPLQVSQQPFLRGQLAHPDSRAYVVAHELLYEAEGLTVDTVQRAIRQALQEADSLNRYLHEDDAGNWWNVPGEVTGATHTFLDFSTAPDPLAAFRSWCLQDVASPLPLHGPAIGYRDCVAALREGQIGWYAIAHHALTDGWGGMLQARRVSELVGAFHAGLPAPAPTASSLREHAAEPAGTVSGAAEYWLSQLRDAPQRVSFTEHTAAAIELPRAGTFDIPEARLAEAAGSTSLSWRDLVAGAVLSYTTALVQGGGDGAALVGLPVVGRHSDVAKRSHLTAMTTLPLRVDVNDRDCLLDVSARFRARLKESYAHQRVLMSDLRETSPELFRRPRLYGPLLNIIPFHSSIDAGEVSAKHRVISYGPVDDFSFTFEPRRAGWITAEILANPALYSEEDFNAHVERFASWCAQLLDAPTTPLADIPALTPSEKASATMLAATSSAIPAVAHTVPPWGTRLPAAELAALASSATGRSVTGIAVRSHGGRTCTFGQVGELHALTDTGLVPTGLLAAPTVGGAVFRGAVADRYEVGEYTVEKGQLLRALEGSSGEWSVEFSGGKILARTPSPLSAEEKKSVRDALRAVTPARVRVVEG